MVVIKLQGGLGNQMFQYAAAKSLAVRLKADVFLDLSWFSNIPATDTKRWYELDYFALEKNTIDINKYTVISKGLGRATKAKRYVMAKNKKNILWSFDSPDQKYHKEYTKLKGNIYLEGWFTSEKYFKDIREELLKEFIFTIEANEKSKNLLSEIEKTSSVSLHVRRGDYLKNKNAKKWHGVKGNDYYRTAIEIMNTRIKNPVYFVFSDDIQWCKKNIITSKKIYFVDHNKYGAEDLMLMCECKNNIITNSTFSWWGAWLNRNNKKIVIAPEAWLNDSSVDTSDVLPKEWIKI